MFFGAKVMLLTKDHVEDRIVCIDFVDINVELKFVNIFIKGRDYYK